MFTRLFCQSLLAAMLIVFGSVACSADSGPPDGGPTEEPSTSPQLIIRMTGATAGTGIAYRITRERPPPETRVWNFDPCVGGPRMVDASTVECTVYHPETPWGDEFTDFFPFDTGSGAAHTSSCTRTTCPGAYSVTAYLLSPSHITTVADTYDANGSGSGDLGDGAAMRISYLP